MYYHDKLSYRDKNIMIIDTVVKSLSHTTTHPHKLLPINTVPKTRNVNQQFFGLCGSTRIDRVDHVTQIVCTLLLLLKFFGKILSST